MQHAATSLRAFIGAKDFALSRQFYHDLGFAESQISADMSYFSIATLGFYLQDAYVKDWINNTMLFLEVDDVPRYWQELNTLALPKKYPNVRLTAIKEYDWGRECFLHDPSGILWHFGQYYQVK